jgi:hypothetical protein
MAVFALIAVVMVTRRPPRQIQYELNGDGIVIDDQQKSLDTFRAFGVRHDGAIWQLVLIPIRRFGAETTIFIHEDQGEEIVDFLGARLPMEDARMDPVDRVSKFLKL